MAVKYFTYHEGRETNDAAHPVPPATSSNSPCPFSASSSKWIAISPSPTLTMDQLLGKSTLDAGFNTTLLAAFATLSLLLAAVGLFGVLSYIAAQRTSEIGIRLALGAPRQQVMQLMLMDGMGPAFLGLILGLAVSVEAARLLRAMLYETRPLDPLVFVGVSATILVVAALACVVPAWRASRVDPVQALRTE